MATLAYCDTSALAKVMRREPESDELASDLASQDGLVSSEVARLELRRMAHRIGIDLELTDEVLAQVRLVPLDRALLTAAGAALPGNPGTLDAIHLATATRLGAAVTSFVAYDRPLLHSATELQFDVSSPGRRLA